MRTRIYNHVKDASLKDVASSVYSRTVRDFNPSRGDFPAGRNVEEEIERYNSIGNHFAENRMQRNFDRNKDYVRAIITEFLKIYSHLQKEAGLTNEQLAKDRKLETPLMRKCSKDLGLFIVKTLPDFELK